MTEPDLIGTILADRYRILEKLGDGAMGNVYLGEHLKIGRHDAIKVLRAAVAGDPEAEARFLRGARIVSTIRHPNVCTIYDFGDAAAGLQFLAMEFVPGETLKDLLTRTGPLPLARAIEIARQTAAALQAAHEVGVVHRDLKPGNIMISPGRDGADAIKVVDFDIAKGSDEGEGSEVTRHGFVVGTPEYMSPEQLMGEKLDGRSDVYSLALVLFRMLTGVLPFMAETTQDIMILRLTQSPLRLDEALPGAHFPEPLQQALDRALARKAADRQPDAETFGREIGAILGDAVLAGTALGVAELGRNQPGAAAEVATERAGTGTAGGGITDSDPGVAPGRAVRDTTPSPEIPPTQVSPAARLDSDPARAAEAAATATPARPTGTSGGGARKLWIPAAAFGGVVILALSALLLLRQTGRETVSTDSGAVPDVTTPTGAPAGGQPGAGATSPTAAVSSAIRPADASATNQAPQTSGRESAGTITPETIPDPGPASPPPATTTPSPIAVAAANEILWRQFERVGTPNPPRATLVAAIDTAEAVWGLEGVSRRDRAFAAYIVANALVPIGERETGRIWAERAVELCPDSCAGYQDLLAYYRSPPS